MSWLYNQMTGSLYHSTDSPDGRKVKSYPKGYSGYREGKNNPELADIKNLGPIPEGTYFMKDPRDSKNTGPFVIDLVPTDHTAQGRTDFQLHGDSITKPGEASRGCVVLPRWVRKTIADSGDREFKVITTKTLKTNKDL